MKTNPYPLKFKPLYKEYIWGGTSLKEMPGRSAGPTVRAESWEISDRPEEMSIVTNGALRGRSLGELVDSSKLLLVGKNATGSGFPLIVKIIDAAENLSIQVHPDKKAACQLGADPKTEAWYIIDAKPGACIYCLKKGTTKKTLASAINKGTIERLLRRIPVSKGQFYLLPSGTVHAIGKGCLIMEVQQNSNSTYRLYDWNRKDKEGKPRQLHTEEALKSINWHSFSPVRLRPSLISRNKTCSLYCAALCKYFVLERLVLKEKAMINQTGSGSFTVIFNPSADVSVICEGKTVLTIKTGSTCLIPAGLSRYEIEPSTGKAELILARLP